MKAWIISSSCFIGFCVLMVVLHESTPPSSVVYKDAKWHVTCMIGETMIDERSSSISFDQQHILHFTGERPGKTPREYAALNMPCIWRQVEP